MIPSFLTFTGFDSAASLDDMRAMSADYPIEWGVLFHPTEQGSGRFASHESIERLIDLGLRISAHLCGGYARAIVEGRPLPAAILRLASRFARLQINTAQRCDPTKVASFCERFGARGILQCRDEDAFPQSTAVDWLFDRSGGKGKLAERWPAPAAGASSLVGYSGGLGPDSVRQALEQITLRHPATAPFWLDMESGVRTDGQFDTALCRTVCQKVFDQ